MKNPMILYVDLMINYPTPRFPTKGSRAALLINASFRQYKLKSLL